MKTATFKLVSDLSRMVEQRLNGKTPNRHQCS